MRYGLMFGIWLAFLGCVMAVGQERSATQPQEDKKPPASQPSKEDKPAAAVSVEKVSTTEHEVRIGGENIHYHATAANMLMKDEAGKLKANVFFVAYEKDHAPDADP